MAEVEPQTIRRIQRTALRYMVAQRFPQRFMQQGRGRVVGPDCSAARMIDFQLDGIAF